MSTLPRYNPEADTGWVSGEGRGGREEGRPQRAALAFCPSWTNKGGSGISGVSRFVFCLEPSSPCHLLLCHL